MRAIVLCGLVAGPGIAIGQAQAVDGGRFAATTGAPAAATTLALPADLDFREFFRFPVGAYGLEPSTKLLRLDGARVRIAGYMVEEEAPTQGRFILAPRPVTLSDVEDGPADDLPPAVVYVHLPAMDAGATPGHQREALRLVGVLSVGNQEEPGGRVSYVRLVLDPPLPSAAR